MHAVMHVVMHVVMHTGYNNDDSKLVLTTVAIQPHISSSSVCVELVKETLIEQHDKSKRQAQATNMN